MRRNRPTEGREGTRYAIQVANQAFGHDPPSSGALEAFIWIALVALGLAALRGC